MSIRNYVPDTTGSMSGCVLLCHIDISMVTCVCNHTAAYQVMSKLNLYTELWKFVVYKSKVKQTCVYVCA